MIQLFVIRQEPMDNGFKMIEVVEQLFEYSLMLDYPDWFTNEDIRSYNVTQYVRLQNKLNYLSKE